MHRPPSPRQAARPRNQSAPPRSHRTTMSLQRFLSALVFITATAGWTGANAQFSNNPAAATGSVVTTPQVRAELLAHAPEGVGKLANYGYGGQVLLTAPLQVPASFKPPAGGNGQIEVRLRATWLACRVECIPEEGSFVLQLPVRGSTAMHGTA